MSQVRIAPGNPQPCPGAWRPDHFRKNDATAKNEEQLRECEFGQWL
jgi:hypothetical protein